jgi:hypothetical protein
MSTAPTTVSKAAPTIGPNIAFGEYEPVQSSRSAGKLAGFVPCNFWAPRESASPGEAPAADRGEPH